MERATDVIGETTSAEAVELESCLGRIRQARHLLPFQVGGLIYKSERLNPATREPVRILSVATLGDGEVAHYRLDELKSLLVDDVTAASIAEAVGWCAIGRPSSMDPAEIALCAAHSAGYCCYTVPLAMSGGLAPHLVFGKGASPRIVAADEIPSVLNALGHEEPGEVVLGSGGLLVWGSKLGECVDRALAVARTADEQLTNVPAAAEVTASLPEVSVPPLLRGLFGMGGPILCARIGAPYERILWSYGDLLDGVAPLPTVVLSIDKSSESPALMLPVSGAPVVSEAPVIATVPHVGAWALHRDARIARTAAALFERYIACAAQHGKAVPSFAVTPEYWATVAPDPPKPLTGKVALVTGAGSGIGLATARRLQAEGACVLLVDVNAARLEEELNTLRDEVGDDYIDGVTCDVRDPASVQAAFDKAVERWGGLDILINCAGLSFSRSIEETSPEEYDLQNDVMPRGSFLCCRAAARILRLQGLGGDIVYIASKNGLFAGPNNVAYGTAKAAQLHQARLVAAELAPIHVRVNTVNPDAVVRGSGIFSHGWGENRAKAYGVKPEELGKYYASRSLLKEEILPEDIAAAVFVLVGPELRKSTGLMINVDGGFVPAMPR